MGPSNKTVYLPDDTTLKASKKTMLLFSQLSNKAREADILPGLKPPLMSVNKMAKEGYTTVFYPGKEGVTVHNPVQSKYSPQTNRSLPEPTQTDYGW